MMQQPNLISFKEDLEENRTENIKNSPKKEEKYLNLTPEPVSADNRLV